MQKREDTTSRQGSGLIDVDARTSATSIASRPGGLHTASSIRFSRPLTHETFSRDHFADTEEQEEDAFARSAAVANDHAASEVAPLRTDPKTLVREMKAYIVPLSVSPNAAKRSQDTTAHSVPCYHEGDVHCVRALALVEAYIDLQVYA